MVRASMPGIEGRGSDSRLLATTVAQKTFLNSLSPSDRKEQEYAKPSD